MTGIVVLAHGSREPQAEEQWRALEQAVHTQVSHAAASRIVFQFGMDGLPAALDSLATQGASAITILPYFLFTGYHLRQTVPTLMQTWQKAHPKVRLSLAPVFGTDPTIADLLAARIGENQLER